MQSESNQWECDPGTVLFNLRGLPVFPKTDAVPDLQVRLFAAWRLALLFPFLSSSAHGLRAALVRSCVPLR